MTSLEAFDFLWSAVYTKIELIERARKGENYKAR
jgi:hypothetical protein